MFMKEVIFVVIDVIGKECVVICFFFYKFDKSDYCWDDIEKVI